LKKQKLSKSPTPTLLKREGESLPILGLTFSPPLERTGEAL